MVDEDDEAVGLDNGDEVRHVAVGKLEPVDVLFQGIIGHEVIHADDVWVAASQG